MGHLKRSLKKSMHIYIWEPDYIQIVSGQFDHDANENFHCLVHLNWRRASSLRFIANEHLLNLIPFDGGG